MSDNTPSPAGTDFIERIRSLEEELFAHLLDPENKERMKNVGQYSWLYRPSHHAKTGLVRGKDIALLQTGRVLSVGAAPAMLESVMCALGVPPKNITIADSNPAILTVKSEMHKKHFDMTKPWPDLSHYNLILFPESLCIALTDATRDPQEKTSDHHQFPDDKVHARILAHILGEALSRLHPEGEIRANGPMNHPNVVTAASDLLKKRGIAHSITYERFFLVVRH